MRIRLPLHYWAEQLQNVMANRMYRPHCIELKREQYSIWRKMVKEYKYMIEEMATLEPNKIEAAWRNEVGHFPVLPHNSLK